MSANNWRHKDIWTLDGKDFIIQVSRHGEPSQLDDFGDGPHRWCVYAYIYPGHPRFGLFSGEEMWQPAATDLHLHGGPSLLRRHVSHEGVCTSVQVGADYHHLHDERFTHFATKEEAYTVFADAAALHRQLTEKIEEPA